jgi:hypothetical protein
MRKVYYKGQPYNFKTLGTSTGSRRFSLYNKEGLLQYFVEEEELDRRSLVNTILNAYYRSIMEEDSGLGEFVWGGKSTKGRSPLGFLNSSAAAS